MPLSDFSPHYLKVEEDGDVAVVSFNNTQLTDEENIEQLGHELFAVVDQFQKQKVLLDLTGVKIVNSSVLGKMITLHRKLHRDDGKLAICNAGEYVSEILRTSQLHDYFNIADDRDAGRALLD